MRAARESELFEHGHRIFEKYCHSLERILVAQFRFQYSDVVCMSVPKSGRTWLRNIVGKILCDLDGVPFSQERIQRCGELSTDFYFSHSFWITMTEKNRWKRLGHTMPKSIGDKKHFLLLVRDPRDVVVSMYYHFKYRANIYDGTISDFISHENWGIKKIVDCMIYSHKYVEEHHDKSIVIRFEDLKVDTVSEVERIIDVLLPNNVNRRLISAAVDFCSIENMKKREQYSKSDIFRQANDNPNSAKVRKGKIGGYKEEFSASECSFLDKEVERLQKMFGYE